MSKARRAIRPAPTEPRVRRVYCDCRYGQLHVRCAMPAGGGFDEATTLLCIPGAPGSGRFFQPLLAPLGRDRSVYAPDLPGCGESDPIPGEADGGKISDISDALGDLLDSMHLRCVDLLAHEDGVPIALALAQRRATQIARVVLSPCSEPVRAAASGLCHPTLLIDLRAADSDRPDVFATERQAAQLREFLGLA